MNQLLEKIKNWFLGVFDNAADFCREKWEDQRLLCIAVLAAFLLIILLLILIPALSDEKTSAVRNTTAQIHEIELEPFLAIPEEPSIENDYVYSRKNITRWSDESVEKWFSEPDDEMIDELRKANEKLVDDMMEVVP